MSNKNYLVNVAAALTGHEGFQVDPAHANALRGMSMAVIVLYLLFIVVFSAGAASLSYKYNISIGNSFGLSVLYSALSFVFSSLYYPYYAFMLNPVGTVPSILGSQNQKGGKRR